MVTTITKNRNQNQNHLTDKKIHFQIILTKLSLSRLITVESFLSVRAVVDSRKGVNRDL